jgi:hypothetical protein
MESFVKTALLIPAQNLLESCSEIMAKLTPKKTGDKISEIDGNQSKSSTFSPSPVGLPISFFKTQI